MQSQVDTLQSVLRFSVRTSSHIPDSFLRISNTKPPPQRTHTHTLTEREREREQKKKAERSGARIASTVDAGSVESLRYYMSRRTLIEMLRDRGYVVPDMEAELYRSLANFRATFGENPETDLLRVIASRATNPSRKILAIFCGNFEIKKRNMVGILSQIVNKETLDRVILILQSKMNFHAQKITDLLVNITKHFQGPKHEILTTAEKETLLKKHSIEEKQLPMMLENDAIARYYGLKKGQVVKVNYSGGVTEAMVTYRCVT